MSRSKSAKVTAAKHPFLVSNEKIGKPIGSSTLLKAILDQNAYANTSSSSNKRNQNGVMLLEEKQIDILSVVKKSLKEASSICKGKELNKDLLQHHFRFVAYCLQSICPIVSSRKSVDHTIKFLHHSIATLGNHVLQELRQKDTDKNESIAIFVMFFFQLSDSLANILHQINFCPNNQNGSTHTNICFPTPNMSSALKKHKNQNASSTSATRAATSLSETQICKIVLDTLSSLVCILATYTPKFLNSVTIDSLTVPIIAEYQPTKLFKYTSLSSLHQIIHKIAIPWIQVSLEHSLKDPKDTSQIPTINAHIKRLYKYLWNMATAIEKLPIQSSNKEKRDPFTMSLNVRKDAICLLLASFSGDRTDAGIGQVTIISKNFEMACTSGWKACVFYSQTQQQNQNSNHNNTLSTYHEQLGSILDQCMRLLYTSKNFNIVERIAQNSYIEYCAWRALQTSPKSKSAAHQYLSFTDDKENLGNKINPSLLIHSNDKIERNSKCPSPLLKYPFVHRYGGGLCPNNKVVAGSKSDIHAHLFQATLAIVFLHRNLQFEYDQKQLQSSPCNLRAFYELEQSSHSVLQTFTSTLDSLNIQLKSKMSQTSIKNEVMQCWKIISQLKLNTFANKLIRCFHVGELGKQDNDEMKSGIEGKIRHITAIITIRCLDTCVIPILSILTWPSELPRMTVEQIFTQSEEKNIDENEEMKKFRNIAMSSHLVCATLLHRICQNNFFEEKSTRHSILNHTHGEIVETINKKLRKVFCIAMEAELDDKMIQAFINSCRMISKERIERKHYSECLDPLILSCYALTEISNFISHSNLSFSYANIASILQKSHCVHESIISLALSTRYKIHESNSNIKTNFLAETSKLLMGISNVPNESFGSSIEHLIKLYLNTWKSNVQETNPMDISPEHGCELKKDSDIICNSHIGQILQKVQKDSFEENFKLFSLSSLINATLCESGILTPVFCSEEKIEILRTCLHLLGKEICTITKEKWFNMIETQDKSIKCKALSLLSDLTNELESIVKMAVSAVKELRTPSNNTEYIECDWSCIGNAEIEASVYVVVSKTLETYLYRVNGHEKLLDGALHNHLLHLAYSYAERSHDLMDFTKNKILRHEVSTFKKAIYFVKSASLEILLIDLEVEKSVTKSREKTSLLKIFTLCIRAFELLSSRNNFEKESTKEKKDTSTFAHKALISLLISLHEKFCLAGETISTAFVSWLLHCMGDTEYLKTRAKIETASIFRDCEIYDIAQSLLMNKENDIYIMRESESEEDEDASDYCTHQLITIELQVIRLLLKIRSSEPALSKVDVLELENIAKRIQEYDSRIHKIKKKSIPLQLAISWLSSTCIAALSEAYKKMGNISKSLFYMRDNCRLCRSALCKSRDLLSMKANSNLDVSKSIVAFTKSNSSKQWQNRLAGSLRVVATLYVQLGDRRKAEDYAFSAIESLCSKDLVENNKTEYSPLNTSLNDNKYKAECVRALEKIKDLQIHPDLISKKATEFIYSENEMAPSNSLRFQDSSTDIFFDQKLNSIDSFCSTVDRIRIFISRGEFLDRHVSLCPKTYPKASQKYLEIIDKYLSDLIGFNIGQMTKNVLSRLQNNYVRIEDTTRFEPMSLETQNLGQLISTLKMRQAVAFERYRQKNNQHFLNELYSEVRLSRYTTSTDRSRACYHLGLLHLQNARENGELQNRWKNHSVSLNLNQENKSNGNSGYQSKAQNIAELDIATQYLKEAKKYSGPASTPDARNIFRSLALAVGPESNEESSAILVHRSIGSSARQAVSRAFPFERSGEGFETAGRSSESRKLKQFFDAFDEKSLNSEYIDKMLEESNKILPHDWKVIAATICPTGEMLFASIRSSMTDTIESSIVCLFPDQVTFPGYETAFQTDFIREFNEIITQNRSQLFGPDHANEVEVHGEEEAKRRWWQQRQTANENLNALLKRIDEQYFGNDLIQHLFMIETNEDVCSEENSVASSMSDVTSEESFTAGNLASKFEEACTIKETRSDKLNSDHKEFDIDDTKKICSKLTVVKLKQELEKYGVEKKVLRQLRKAGLVDLLVSEKEKEYYNNYNQNRDIHIDSLTAVESIPSIEKNSDHPIESVPSKMNQSAINPCTFLVLDEHLHRFPWEGTQLLSNRAVCRVPSLPFVIAPLIEYELRDDSQKSNLTSPEPVIDPKRARFVLDPEDNLHQTAKRLQPILDSMSSKLGWEGVTKKMPSPDFISDALLDEDSLYIYCGHGGGECCYSRSKVEGLLHPSRDSKTLNRPRRCRSSVILMGCSSASLNSFKRSNEILPEEATGFFEPDGIALSYLSSGSPCVVGNLWDVTDRDIDRFFVSLLDEFIGIDELRLPEKNLAQCVANARNSCKMRFIVGCAPVCYGVPVKRSE